MREYPSKHILGAASDNRTALTGIWGDPFRPKPFQKPSRQSCNTQIQDSGERAMLAVATQA